MSGDQDLLERATRALREATPPTQDELAASRARLLAAHRVATKNARSRTLRWVLPLAAMLAAGTALAATPEAFERMARAVSSLLAPDATKLAAKPKRVRPAADHGQPVEAPRPTPTPAPEPTPEEPAQAAAQPPAEASEQVAAVEPSHARRRASRARRVAEPAPTTPVPIREPVTEPAPEPKPEPAADGDLAQYREAHRVHFRVRDFSAALRDWDAYLAAYPSGTFAVEARYNRAICLVRLGRNADAKQALTPFSRGEVAHGYRQAEAKKLLEALE